jgi:N-acetylmuramoyl-L-alanine amidase
MTDKKTSHENNPRRIKYLVVHCTAGSQKEKVSDLVAYFKRKGWKNAGYHYVIEANGSISQICDEKKIANGVLGYNSNSIHVSYLGGIGDFGKPKDNRTDAQKKALLEILCELKSKYPAAKIKGHRDFSPDLDHDGKIEYFEYIKACPCFDAEVEYSHLNK